MDSRRGHGGRLCLSVILVLCAAASWPGVAGCVAESAPAPSTRALMASAAVDDAAATTSRPSSMPTAAGAATQQTSEPVASPDSDSTLPDVGPVDHLGERPRLIRDAPPAARAELAKKLVNPLSDLIRVPIRMNYDEGFGPTDAHRFTWTLQPFIPVRLSDDWNLISRTNLPVVRQQSPIPGGDDQFGIGDIGQSVLLAPQDRAQLWAIGPTFLFPTADDEFIGLRKWAVGPSGVWLKEEGPWTGGVIVGHLWSFAGDDDRRNINLTTVSPFLAYTTPDAFTFLLDIDAFYDWDAVGDEPWLVPISLSVGRVRRLGRHLVNVGAAGRYYAESPENGPEWGVQLFVTFLFRR